MYFLCGWNWFRTALVADISSTGLRHSRALRGAAVFERPAAARGNLGCVVNAIWRSDCFVFLRLASEAQSRSTGARLCLKDQPQTRWNVQARRNLFPTFQCPVAATGRGGTAALRVRAL